MCTVTFIPTSSGIYLTSNRDERPDRTPARFPVRSGIDGDELLYPQDGEAGGSWIALRRSGQGDAAVLLNGALVKHPRGCHYRKSRGLVFLEIACAADPLLYYQSAILNGIEPFTLILFTGRRLFECRWDGMNRHVSQISHERPHIWSSSTLYDEDASKDRRRRFEEWYCNTSQINEESVLNFHRCAIRSPQEKIVTVSITSIRIASSRTSMRYVDLQTNKPYETA